MHIILNNIKKIKSIKQVYRVDKIYENDFKKYNWVVLD